MNCVCGCSVFDHAKVYSRRILEFPIGHPAYFFLHSPFTLSGRCLKCGMVGGYDAPRCRQFKRAAKYASALRHLAETPMRLLVLMDEAMKPAEEIPPGPYPLVDPTKWKNFSPLDRGIDGRRWWKKYDRPPEPGRTETM